MITLNPRNCLSTSSSSSISMFPTFVPRITILFQSSGSRMKRLFFTSAFSHNLKYKNSTNLCLSFWYSFNRLARQEAHTLALEFNRCVQQSYKRKTLLDEANSQKQRTLQTIASLTSCCLKDARTRARKF